MASIANKAFSVSEMLLRMDNRDDSSCITFAFACNTPASFDCPAFFQCFESAHGSLPVFKGAVAYCHLRVEHGKGIVTVGNSGDKLSLYGLPVITASLQGGSGTTFCSCEVAEDVQFPACCRSCIICLCRCSIVLAGITFGIQSE